MDFSSIHNYYEHLVVDYMVNEIIPNMPDKDADFFLDVTCFVLTKLPARYMRHEVDMAFYLSSDERLEMIKRVKETVAMALEYIGSKNDREYRKESSNCEKQQ